MNGKSLRGVRQMAARTAKQSLGAALYYTGMLPLIRKTLMQERGIKILAYHRVGGAQFVLPGMNIKTSHFEQHLRHIVREHTPLSLMRAVEMITNRERIPENAVVITFDDGYRDNYLNAFPLLRKYGVPATIFLSVAAIEENTSLWFDIITEAFRQTGKTSYMLPYGTPALSLRTDRERLSAAGTAVEAGKRLAPRERERYIAQVLNALGICREDLALKRSMITWEEVAHMEKEGVSFGSHGLSHTVLTALSLPELEREIGCSKEIIRARAGISVALFAYPNGGTGDFGTSGERFLRSSGYTAACTLIKGLNDCTINRYALRRVCVTEGMESDAFGNFSRPIFAAALS